MKGIRNAIYMYLGGSIFVKQIFILGYIISHFKIHELFSLNVLQIRKNLKKTGIQEGS
jgi:hypothetical protein